MENNLSRKERRRLRREKREKEKMLIARKHRQKKIVKSTLGAIAAVGVIAVFLLAMNQREILPPQDIQGHIEVSPARRFLTQPMDIRVHKHMLEHADGNGPPGVIINYNCQDFVCETELLEKLERLTEEYPQRLYVAPYPNMSAKLVITKLGKQMVLSEFAEQQIREFIED